MPRDNGVKDLTGRTASVALQNDYRLFNLALPCSYQLSSYIE